MPGILRLLTPLAVLAALAFTTSCASRMQVVRVVSRQPDFVVKEGQVTGRAEIYKDVDSATLAIPGVVGPDGSPLFRIGTDFPVKVMKGKLDASKSYRFTVYTTDQTMSDRHIHHAVLVKIEDGGTVVLDASVCDIHHCQIDFREAENVSWWLRSKREQRDRDTYHHHGFVFPSCCSGGMVHWWVWHCPRCAKIVDGFKSKFEPG